MRVKEKRGEETSWCNLLLQHSFSDVVWHLVHKANQIHTLPSYISGKRGEKDRETESWNG